MDTRVHVVLSCLLLGPALLGLPGSAPAAATPTGTVVAAPVLGGPEPPPPEARRLRHVHASSSWTASVTDVAADLRRWRRSADLVTMTESAGDAARQATLRAPGWTSAWFAGTGPRPARRADASVQWRDTAWAERARATLPLSDRAFPVEEGTERGIASNATAVVLEQRATGVVLLVTVAHLPSLVERPDGTGFDPAPVLASRVAAYDDALAGYRAQVARLTRRHDPDVRLVVADWNVDVKRPWARAHLRRAWAGSGLVPAWPAAYDGPGTFEDVRDGYVRSRLIDGTLVDEGTSYVARPRVLAPVASSDHRPYAETLRLPGAPGATGVTPLR